MNNIYNIYIQINLHTYLFNYAGKKYPLVYLDNHFSDCHSIKLSNCSK